MSGKMDERVSGAWWSRPASELLEALDVDREQGLSSGRVEEMRRRFGANELVEAGPTSLAALLWDSLTSPMMLLLLAVAGISLALGRVREAIFMAVVVLIYVGVELYNKARSDRTMARLRELQTPQVTLLRDGERVSVEVGEVVVGDVIPLQPGSRVAADGRLLFSAGLLIDEAALTGESSPQGKRADVAVSVDAALAERPTAVFAGTTVLDGQGKALVVAVGEETELGRVAELTARAVDEPTPLQQEMKDLARTLAYVAVGISVLIPLAGLLRGFDLEQMVLTWLSLTFLMVPGQPPVIVTMALALPAVPEGSRNPTDRALMEAGHALHPSPAPQPGTLVDQSGLVRGEQFRSLTYDKGGERWVYATGSPEFALARSTHWQRGKETRPFAEDGKDAVRQRVEELAAQGRRVVGYVYGRAPDGAEEIGDLVLVGCVALEGPIRPEVGAAVARLRTAGVRTLMVTGDRAATARHVAQEVGLESATLITGQDLEGASDGTLEDVVRRGAVFARVTPEQKLQLALAVKRQGVSHFLSHPSRLSSLRY